MRRTMTREECQPFRSPHEATKTEAVDRTAEVTDPGADGWELVTTGGSMGATKFRVCERPSPESESA